MFDYLRNLTKSAEEKQQEALNAYLDDTLLPKQRQQFEQMLADDADLRQELEQRRALQMQMRQMPRRRVPRNFTLDPAVYGRPQRQPLFQLYPAMRVATVLTAVFFILAIGIDLFLNSSGSASMPGGVSQDVAMVAEEAMEEPPAETAVEAPLAAPMEQIVEVTRVVTEVVVEEGEALEIATQDEAAVEMFAEEPAAAELAEEEAMPAAEAPEPQADTAAEAAGAESETDQVEAGTAVPPSPSPAATLTLPLVIDATKSTVPRPESGAANGERAITAVPTSRPETAQETLAEPTAVPVPAAKRMPINGLRWLQIGLGALLIVLGTAVYYVRRQL